jgi:hypothetical protein
VRWLPVLLASDPGSPAAILLRPLAPPKPPGNGAGSPPAAALVCDCDACGVEAGSPVARTARILPASRSTPR